MKKVPLKKNQKGGVINYLLNSALKNPQISQAFNNFTSNPELMKQAMQTYGDVAKAQVQAGSQKAAPASQAAAAPTASAAIPTTNGASNSSSKSNSSPTSVVTSPPVVSTAGAGPKMPQGMNEAFVTMYKLLATICAFMFVIMFFIGWGDIILYLSNESGQYWKMIKDPNLFVKDTTDYESMKYITTNSIEEEPYSIFLEETIISYVYRFFGIFVLLFAVQYGIFFSFMLYAKFKQLPFNETVQPPYMNIGTVLVAFIGAIVLSSIYKLYFIKKSQTSLKDTRTQLRDMKQYIYKNLTTNADFLTAMINNDLNALLTIFNNEINKNNRNNCTSPTSNCDAEVQRMIFTSSLYSYLNEQIPEADPNYETIKQIFTIDNIRKRAIDPTQYFYYKQPIYIPTMYSSLQEINGKPFFTDTARESVFFTGLTTLFQTCNKKFARIQTISNGKNKIANYLIMFAVIVTVFLGIFIGIYYNDLKPVLEWLKTFLKSLYDKIFSKTEVQK